MIPWISTLLENGINKRWIEVAKDNQSLFSHLVHCRFWSSVCSFIWYFTIWIFLRTIYAHLHLYLGTSSLGGLAPKPWNTCWMTKALFCNMSPSSWIFWMRWSRKQIHFFWEATNCSPLFSSFHFLLVRKFWYTGAQKHDPALPEPNKVVFGTWAFLQVTNKTAVECPTSKANCTI